MIFGFNTDVARNDTVYHVQTEDRGAKNPLIESILYLGGKIVDRRWTRYDPEKTPAQEIAEMVRTQHKNLVEAIRSGTFTPAAEAQAVSARRYTVEVRNTGGIFDGQKLQFQISVLDRDRREPARDIVLEVRWVLNGAVIEQRRVPSPPGGVAVLSLQAPKFSADAYLLVCAEGPGGRELAKFHVRGVAA